MNDEGARGGGGTSARAPFSLMRGGLFYSLMLRAHVVRPGRREALRPALVVMAITWLPFAILSILHWIMTGKVSAVARDPETHARLLFATPLIFLSEILLDERCELTYQVLVERYVHPEVEAKAIARRAERLRDALAPELFIGIVSLVLGQLFLWGMSRPSGMFRGMPVEGYVSAPLLWYGVVALPLFNVVFFRLFYRWIIWSWMLIRFAIMGVRPIATHPDLAGGLGCTSEPIGCFAGALSGVSIVVATHWGYRIKTSGADVLTFAPDLAALIALALFAALGPLLAFSPRLWRVRLDGIEDYNRLANVHSTSFDEKWILHRQMDPLGTQDISSLADLGTSYERIERMRLVPFGRRAPLIVVAAIAIPMLPLITLKIPLPQLIASLGRAVLGGLPP